MAFSLFSSILIPFFFFLLAVNSTTFTFTNKCANTVWPATLSNSGTAPLSTTGFILPSGASLAIQAPTGWSGRFWARTSCTTLSPSNHLTCATGDCGSGQIECSGNGATPPATLAEFTLAGPSSTKDFYDVSLVDGYNIPMMVVAANGGCEATGCAVDLNMRCPAELKVGEGEGEGCRSACEAFGKEEYVFIIFCPNSSPSSPSSDSSSPSQKSSRDGSTEQQPTTKGAVLEGGESWLANLAMGDAPSSSMRNFSIFHHFSLILFLISFLF